MPATRRLPHPAAADGDHAGCLDRLDAGPSVLDADAILEAHLVADALALEGLERTFDVAIDCASFRCRQRGCYASGVTDQRADEGRFESVDEVGADPAICGIYAEGWQSGSASGLYGALEAPPRPSDDDRLRMVWRAASPPPAVGIQGEGLLAVVRQDGQLWLWSAPDPTKAVPSIRATPARDRILISADGPVIRQTAEGALNAALARWAEGQAGEIGVRVRPIAPGWCSWYFYFRDVTESDVLENLEAADRLELPIEFVLVDDGYEAGIGDWLEGSPRFGSLERLLQRIRDADRRPGVWTAPFLVGANSRLAAAHPEWLVAGADAGWNWGQRLWVLDVTHPAAAEHLARVYRRLRDWGVDYFKLDFLYAGALAGHRWEETTPVDAYRAGLRIIRNAVGPGPILAGCGAPILPSIGLVDVMRTGRDVLAESQRRGATDASGLVETTRIGRSRAWTHGRFWTADADCLIARPQMTGREAWAAYLDSMGGLALSGDRLIELDAQGLELTRRLLRPSSIEPIAWDPFA